MDLKAFFVIKMSGASKRQKLYKILDQTQTFGQQQLCVLTIVLLLVGMSTINQIKWVIICMNKEFLVLVSDVGI